MNRPQEIWSGYVKKVYGTDPMPRTQERECSRAFYAGMMAAILVMIRISEQELDAGAEDISKLRDELKEAAAKIA